jgi:hypothetical protein
MLKSEWLPSLWKVLTVRVSVAAWCLLVTVLALLPSGFGQTPDFTLLMAPFPPPAAVNPGGTAASNITLGTLNGFNGTVDLTCQVTPQPANYASSDCLVSPSSVAPPGGATATITTTLWPAGLYAITITGTASGTSNSHSAQQNLTVLAVTPSFTITVTQQVLPSSVHAGSGGRGIISINPLNGYSGSVTLSCATITPLVTIPPQCSFDPNPAAVNSGMTVNSTISISTIGPLPRAAAARARIWYAWLPLPMLAVAGVGLVSGRRLRRAWCLLTLFVAAGAILLLPACGNNNNFNTNSNTGLITPNNGYTFTLMGVDANGVTSSNAGASAPTVTLTVD